MQAQQAFKMVIAIAPAFDVLMPVQGALDTLK
jgi:hypothetical protein